MTAGPAEARARMVERQIAARGIADARLLDAMRSVPREAFVPPGQEGHAHEDGPLPIGGGQTISQPYIVALMAEAARIAPGDRVLEVGAGSGYAAAVLARLGARVFAVERLPSLARGAAERLARLGFENVEVREGDGTLGWPEEAPFDAIVVSAGGPAVPAALRGQLAPGGRLVMPVGDEGVQRLLRLTRTGAGWEEEDLGAVRFVPLLGAQGWEGAGGAAGAIAAAAVPLPDPDAPGFGAFFDALGQARVVLLGEATHGTSEFYRARAAITRRLVERHGFNVVAVEADWPDAAWVDRRVRGRPGVPQEEEPFTRFPEWMWRNREVARFLDWLRERNAARSEPERTGFYGLDLYNMGASIAAVLRFLDAEDPDAAAEARRRYACLAPWSRDPSGYGRTVMLKGGRDCEEAVVEQCRALLPRRLEGAEGLEAAQNARLVASAEAYYRAMWHGGAESWNLRDTHMAETLAHVLEARGPEARAVVWAHNSHVGDARFTAMGRDGDEVTLGQLCRERWGEEAVRIVGFGTHAGTAMAARDWDGEAEVRTLRPSREGSHERLCHETGLPRFLLDLRAEGAAREALLPWRPERFVGVIYRPETERASHYAEASLARQFDLWAWFEETRAVTPLQPEAGAGEAETFPFGL